MTKMFAKVITAILVALVVVSVIAFAGCGNDIVAGSGEVYHASETTKTTEVVEQNLVGMQLMGSAGEFGYFRDTSTDVMYLWREESVYEGGMGGLTIMMNPKTGLPLTYSDWIQFKGGEFYGTNENTESSN